MQKSPSRRKIAYKKNISFLIIAIIKHPDYYNALTLITHDVKPSR